MSALKSAHVDENVPCIFDESRLVERMFRGIKRTQTAATPRRFAVTIQILDRLERHFDLSNPTHRLVRAVLWMAVTGLFRIGELTVDSGKSAGYKMLTNGSITVGSNPLSLTVRLTASKMDVFRQSVNVLIVNRKAIAAYDLYASKRTSHRAATDPLFTVTTANGTVKPLDRATILSAASAILTAAGISTANCRGLSFRAGGATSYAAAGLPDHLLQVLGRWQSACYTRYIDTSIDRIVEGVAHL